MENKTHRSEQSLVVSVLDDKFRFVWDYKSPDIRCLRHGEEWMVFGKGAGAILALMTTIEEYEELGV